MSKKKWERPQGRIERFVPNEYVAVCYSLECLVSEESSSGFHNDWSSVYRQWRNNSGLSYSSDGLQHGSPCQNCTYNNQSGSFKENGKDVELKSITINGNYAIWSSSDGSATYSHYGNVIYNGNHS